MTKKLMLGAALGALMISGAMAQTPSSPPPSGATSSPPAATQTPPAAGKSSTMDKSKTSTDSKATMDKSAATNGAAGGKAQFVSSQQSDQWVASKFKGTDVVGSDNKTIGDVSDILFDKTGKIEAYVISVGGFLGMGAKEVALAPSAFDVVPGSNGAAPKLKLAMSKDELKNAQAFARYSPPHPTTTGSGTGGGLGAGGTRPPTTHR